MILQPKKSSLLLSTHPGDIEYSMFGTVVCNPSVSFLSGMMSPGGWNDDSTVDNYRFSEVADFWNNLKNINFLFAQNSYIKSTPEDAMVALIENHISNVSLKFVSIFCPPDCDDHFEKRKVSTAARALARKQPVTLIEYKTPSTPDTWSPNWYVDITKFYERKLTRLNCLKSQKEVIYYNEDVIRSFHTNYHAKVRGLELVEQYKIIQHFE